MNLRWPLTAEYRKITSRFTPPTHWGIDISCPDRTPVYAAHAGVARYEWTELGGYCVRLFGDGITTRYVHIGSYTINDGESVLTGQELGRIGKTGTAWTGYHLHFELFVGSERVDPLVYLEEKVSKGSYHVQDPNPPGWLRTLIYQSGVTTIKQINPDQMGEPWQGLQVIGRLWWNGEPDKALVTQGAAGAVEWWSMAKDRIARCPWVQVWEGPNEVAIWNDVSARYYNEFETQRVKILHDNGKKASSFNFSTGHPEPELFKYLKSALNTTDYLGLHEYGMKRMDPVNDTWHLLRYRRVFAVLKANNIRIPPTIISETGVDYGGNPTADGWIAQGHSSESYVAQLISYLVETDKDPEIVLVTPFGFADLGWPSFSIHETPARLYTEYLRSTQSEQAALLDLAEKWVIPMVPGFALWNHITGKGWVLASREFGYNGANYQWGYNKGANRLTLCRWANGAVSEVYSRAN